MAFNKVVVAGGGVLGSQIAYQAAYCGKEVTIWLRSEGSIGRTQPKLDQLREEYKKAIALMDTPDGKSPANWCRGLAQVETFDAKECLKKSEAAYKNIKLELDLKKACEDADIIIESMAELTEEKIAFYKKLAPVMEDKTILVTNSSTLLPSTVAPYTGKAEKYCSLHFANHIWKQNLVEVMAQDFRPFLPSIIWESRRPCSCPHGAAAVIVRLVLFAQGRRVPGNSIWSWASFLDCAVRFREPDHIRRPKKVDSGKCAQSIESTQRRIPFLRMPALHIPNRWA